MSKYGFSIRKKNITNAAIPKNLSLFGLAYNYMYVTNLTSL